MLELREHQEEVVQKLREGFTNGHRCQLLYAPTGFGKCLAKGTTVIMYDGTIKLVQDIVIGDLLLSPEGHPRMVESIVNGFDMMYEITPSKGDAYCVNSSHILSLRMTGNKSSTWGGDGKQYFPKDIVNISIEDYIKSNKTFKHCAKGWRSDAIDFKTDTPLPVDPYILGAWLGDGTTKEPAITNIEPEIIDYIYQFANEISGRISIWDNGNCCTYRICGGNFLSDMKSIGVIGNKHIPHQYKTASIEARQRLLAGIIDTDGYMFMDNFEITLKVKTLADDICFVARSLGLAAYVKECTKTIKSRGFFGTYHRITISGETDQIPCLVQRKKAKTRYMNKNVRNVGIQVKEAGLGEYYGFSIAGNKKLFLLGDFTVTHNTEVAMAIMKAVAEKYKKCAMVMDRIVLVDQTSRRLTKYGIEHGVMQAGHWRHRPYEHIQVCSAQTLEKRQTFPDIDLLIVDECFVAGTKITTPHGEKDIELVRCGDAVYNQHGIGIVEAVSIKPSDDLYRLEFDDGTVTECTANHPHFTEQGWKTTRELEIGSYFFSEQGVRLLWERVETLDTLWGKRKDNIRYAREGLEYANYLLQILLEEITESNEQSSKPFKNEGNSKRDQAQTYTAWRKRAIVTFATISPTTRTWARVGSRDGNPHEDAERKRLSDLLQAGLSKCNPDVGDRVRWRESRDIGKKSSGQKENGSTYFPRLVNISHIKRESPVSVFNLQVSGHPSYFANGKLVHNCHITRRGVVNFIKDNPQIKVIGLTATPFTKGLGDIYTHVVGATPTGDLIEKGWLVPLKVYVAKEIDMTGVTKRAGEWKAEDVTERGIKIVGDVVHEWHKKTHEIFGKPVKTIVFCAGVEHGRELVKQFNEAGYNFISISYLEDDQYKKDMIEEFSKPDTDIHGLIATDILTRGFDVPDVMIGVSARPFSKSFSSHVQQMGRIMRPNEGKEFGLWLDHCIATGQKVLTHRGLVSIELILLSDKIWDGHEFVSHKGVVSRGKRPVITYAGITATPDHLVKTRDEGWCSLGYCADKQKAIITTGIGRTAIRECDDYFTRRGVVGTKAEKIHARALRVRNLWLSVSYFVSKFTEWKNQGLQAMQSAKTSTKMAKCKSCSNEVSMRESKIFRLQKLWWKGNQVQIRFSDFLRSLDTRELGIIGQSQGVGFGSDRQQRPLRGWKSSVCFKKVKQQQSENIKVDSNNAQVQDGASRDTLCGFNIKTAVERWFNIFRYCRKILPAITETERQVWDILDCGPRNSFTCEGLLVHNSGNFLRFRNDWDKVFFEGVTELKESAVEKVKKEPTEKEKKEAICPACKTLWTFKSNICGSCGFEKKPPTGVTSVNGELLELVASNSQGIVDNKQFYSELLYYGQQKGYKEGWASHKYKEKYGVFPRSIPKEVRPTSIQTMKWIKSRFIAYTKSKESRIA